MRLNGMQRGAALASESTTRNGKAYSKAKAITAAKEKALEEIKEKTEVVALPAMEAPKEVVPTNWKRKVVAAVVPTAVAVVGAVWYYSTQLMSNRDVTWACRNTGYFC